MLVETFEGIRPVSDSLETIYDENDIGAAYFEEIEAFKNKLALENVITDADREMIDLFAQEAMGDLNEVAENENIFTNPIKIHDEL